MKKKVECYRWLHRIRKYYNKFCVENNWQNISNAAPDRIKQYDNIYDIILL